MQGSDAGAPCQDRTVRARSGLAAMIEGDVRDAVRAVRAPGRGGALMPAHLHPEEARPRIAPVFAPSARILSFAGFWEYIPLARAARIVLLVVVLAASVLDAELRLTGELAGSWQDFAASVLVTACLLLMLWRPPAASLALIVAGFPAALLGQGGGYVTALTASVGLIVYACSTAFALLHGAAAVAWIIAIAAMPPGLHSGGVITLFVIALVSAAVGRCIRLVVLRNRTLLRELDSRDARLQAELRAERSRIADELHDVIAHDIAIVAMHARVLERSDDPEVRTVSQRAITEASGQALADTRRILHLIHGTTDVTPRDLTDVRASIAGLADELRALGDDVEVSLADGPPLARSIESALGAFAREAATNIVKHAGTPRQVSFRLSFSRDAVTLRITNTPFRTGAPVLPSSGFGLARLRERAALLGGSFTAGVEDGVWAVRMTLPQR